jgi:predicted GIY-YIG superfamily endonuclease
MKPSYVYVYVLSCPQGLLKLGVAADPRRRLRNLQVGSPVQLELAASYRMSDRPTAEAVAAALQERFREQRERGHWFRATPVQVRRAITERSLIQLYRPSEAGERAAEREAAAAAKAEAAAALAAANAAERRRLRRERRRAAAELLVSGKTQVAVAEAVGVTDRTIRNWAQTKSFQRELERAAERATLKERRRRERNARRRFRRQHPGRWADLQARRPELRSPSG